MKLHHLLMAAGLWAAWADPAAAGLKLCNQTSYIVYAATAWASKTELTARGWTRLAPGDCTTPIGGPLTVPAYFIYAHTSRAHSGSPRAWGGAVPICARDSDFSFKTKLPVHACPGGDFYRMPFALLDRQGRESWTTRFTEPGLKNLKEARHAGVNRLLTDLGYKVNVPGERARDLALEDFHKRAKLPADANEAELFIALETAAIKAVAPAGYTVCNSTEQPLWAAIGFPAGRGNVSRGWWQIARGACARVITAPLKTDRVYLLAQHKGKQPVVSGPVKLCVQDGQFDLSANPRCAGNGFHETGFAVTDTKGRSGYVATVGDNGLLRPTAQTARSSK